MAAHPDSDADPLDQPDHQRAARAGSGHGAGARRPHEASAESQGRRVALRHGGDLALVLRRAHGGARRGDLRGVLGDLARRGAERDLHRAGHRAALPRAQRALAPGLGVRAGRRFQPSSARRLRHRARAPGGRALRAGPRGVLLDHRAAGVDAGRRARGLLVGVDSRGNREGNSGVDSAADATFAFGAGLTHCLRTGPRVRRKFTVFLLARPLQNANRALPPRMGPRGEPS